MTCLVKGLGADDMSSRRQRDEWTEFARRHAAQFQGRIAALAGRLCGPPRRALSALPGVVPTRFLVLLRWLATGLVLLAGVLSVVVILVGAFPHWFGDRRLPLDTVRGVVPGEDAVFVASSSAGRVYKFDLNGGLLDWYQFSGRPISIS